MEAGAGFTCAGIGSGSRGAAPPASTGLSSQPTQPPPPPPTPTTSPPPAPAFLRFRRRLPRCFQTLLDLRGRGIRRRGGLGSIWVGGLGWVELDSAAPRWAGVGVVCGKSRPGDDEATTGTESRKQISARSIRWESFLRLHMLGTDLKVLNTCSTPIRLFGWVYKCFRSADTSRVCF